MSDKKLERTPTLEEAMEMVASLYEAAVDPVQWPGFLEKFASAMNSQATLIWMHDFSSSSADVETSSSSISAAARFDPAFVQSYAEHYTFTNVWAQNEENLAEGVAVNSSMLFPEKSLLKTEFYNDWLKPQDLRYAIGGILLKQGSLAVKFTSVRPEKTGQFGDPSLAFYQKLMPHVRRACLLHQRISHLRDQQIGMMAALEVSPTAVWVLDTQGELLYSNKAGRDLDRRRDGLWLDPRGRPSARDSDQQQLIDRAIRQCTDLTQGITASCTTR